MESVNADNEHFSKEGDLKPVRFIVSISSDKICKKNLFQPLISSTGSLDTATSMIENGGSCGLPLSKQRRTRTLMRQERVSRKEGDKDASSVVENERASPIVHNLQPILPK